MYASIQKNVCEFASQFSFIFRILFAFIINALSKYDKTIFFTMSSGINSWSNVEKQGESR